MVDAFPTVEAMARVGVDAVLKAWEGAGYYSRARRLHALSQRVMLPEAKGGFNGELPGSYDDLLSLPGIGPYTAAAVASIAFQQPVACVDGNVRRVMARHTAQTDPAAGVVQAWADAALHSDRPGDWNQAVMELGATLCTPRKVGCTACPLASSCEGTSEPRALSVSKKAEKIRCGTLGRGGVCVRRAPRSQAAPHVRHVCRVVGSGIHGRARRLSLRVGVLRHASARIEPPKLHRPCPSLHKRRFIGRDARGERGVVDDGQQGARTRKGARRYRRLKNGPKG